MTLRNGLDYSLLRYSAISNPKGLPIREEEVTAYSEQAEQAFVFIIKYYATKGSTRIVVTRKHDPEDEIVIEAPTLFEAGVKVADYLAHYE